MQHPGQLTGSNGPASSHMTPPSRGAVSGRSLWTNTVRLLAPKTEVGRFQGDHRELEERILWLCIQVSSQLWFMNPNTVLSCSNLSLMIRANA